MGLYSIALQKEGDDYNTPQNRNELFHHVLDGNNYIDIHKFDPIFLCITNCSLREKYTPEEIRHFLYVDLHTFIESNYLSLSDSDTIHLRDYYWDHKSGENGDIILKQLLDLQYFLLICIQNKFHLIPSNQYY